VELHAVDWESADLAAFGKPTGYLERQVRRFAQLWAHNRTRDVPGFDDVGDWLLRILPKTPVATVVHGDYRLGNVMFALSAPPRLNAVFDWEMATIGDPLADVGYMSALWADDGDPPLAMLELSRTTRLPGFFTRAELVARYEQQAKRPVTGLRWYEVLALWKSAVFMEGNYKRSTARATTRSTTRSERASSSSSTARGRLSQEAEDTDGLLDTAGRRRARGVDAGTPRHRRHPDGGRRVRRPRRQAGDARGASEGGRGARVAVPAGPEGDGRARSGHARARGRVRGGGAQSSRAAGDQLRGARRRQHPHARRDRFGRPEGALPTPARVRRRTVLLRDLPRPHRRSGHEGSGCDDVPRRPRQPRHRGRPRDLGFRYAQVRLAPARPTHCMRWLGLAQRARDDHRAGRQPRSVRREARRPPEWPR
jgi:hypothetical protein